jgi:hypothetical protein
MHIIQCFVLVDLIAAHNLLPPSSLRAHILLDFSITLLTSNTSATGLSAPMKSPTSRLSSFPCKISKATLWDPPRGNAPGVGTESRGLPRFYMSACCFLVTEPMELTWLTNLISIACLNGTERPNVFLWIVCCNSVWVEDHCQLAYTTLVNQRANLLKPSLERG